MPSSTASAFEFERADLVAGSGVVEPIELEIVEGEGDDVEVVEVNDLLGVRHDRSGVTRQEVFADADADDERRTTTGTDHDAGLIDAENGNAVGADHFPERVHDGLGQQGEFGVGQGVRGFGFGHETVVMDSDQVGENLGVGGGLESMPMGDELAFEDFEVFDDPVMDEDDFSALIEVRV